MALHKQHPDFPRDKAQGVVTFRNRFWKLLPVQDMKLYKCWVSGTEKEIETEEVSWSYERESEAPDFEPEPAQPANAKPSPDEEMKTRYKKEAKDVKAKTTEQLAKSAPRLKHVSPKSS